MGKEFNPGNQAKIVDFPLKLPLSGAIIVSSKCEGRY